MKTLTGFSFILLLALESSILMNTCFAGFKRQVGGEKGQQPGSKWQVTIYNYQTNSVLNAHCKSKEDDLSERVLAKQAQFNWSFRMNFLRTTLFWCNFNSSNGHASFEVFWPENSYWLSKMRLSKLHLGSFWWWVLLKKYSYREVWIDTPLEKMK